MAPEARLAALGSSALPGAEAPPLNVQPRPRVLERAASASLSEAADAAAFEHMNLVRSQRSFRSILRHARALGGNKRAGAVLRAETGRERQRVGAELPSPCPCPHIGMAAR